MVPAAGMGIKLGTRSTRLYGLNLSRCLGDKFLKDGDLGLSAAPHVSPVVRVPPRASGLVVLASDGLWDVAEATRALAVRSSSLRAPRMCEGTLFTWHASVCATSGSDARLAGLQRPGGIAHAVRVGRMRSAPPVSQQAH